MNWADVIKTWKKVDRKPAIKAYCLECSGGTADNVTLCPMTYCPLWGWRFGEPLTNGMVKERLKGMLVRKPEEFKSAYEHLGGAKR